MHLRTYCLLMLLATIYDLIQLVVSWCTNPLLFVASSMVLGITLVVGYSQVSEDESFQFQWMLLYIVPAGLIAFGQLAGFYELENKLLQSVKQSPFLSIIPGVSSDYQSAAVNHYISMLFPLAAQVVARATQTLLLFLENQETNKR